MSLNRLLVLVFLLVVVLAVTMDGCDVELGFVDRGITDAVIVKNHTKTTLHFTLVIANGEPFALHRDVDAGDDLRLLSGGELSPGAGLLVNRCTVGDLTAFTADGHEVARHAPPLCAPAVWVIEQPDNSTNPKSS